VNVSPASASVVESVPTTVPTGLFSATVSPDRVMLVGAELGSYEAVGSPPNVAPANGAHAAMFNG